MKAARKCLTSTLPPLPFHAFGRATAILAARGRVEVASVTCWARVFSWVVMCPTATPRSSTTLVRSARVGAGPPVGGRWDSPAVGVFLPELLGCDMTSAYDDSDSVSEGASHAASRSLMSLCCAPSDFASQSSWWSSIYLLMTSC